jgi:energy-coupling factor transport system substrate-specific component
MSQNPSGVVKTVRGKSLVFKLMLGIVCAAIYGAGLWATGFLPTIPGITWLRPANMFSELFGVSFGWLGCAAIAVGNELGDFLTGGFNPVMLWWLVPLEFMFTAGIVYLGVTDPSLRSVRGKIEWLVFAVIGQGVLTGFGIAFFITRVTVVAPVAAFWTIGTTIALNEAIPAVLAGVLQYFLFPLIVKMGLWMGRDLNKSNIPPAYLKKLLG